MKALTNKEQINKYLDEKGAEGLLRIGITSFLSYTKIGQNLLLQTVLNEKKEGEILEVINQATTTKKEDYIKKIDEKVIAKKGFSAPISMINFTYQLPNEQKQVLKTLLENKEGKELLQGTINDLLKNYVYTS